VELAAIVVLLAAAANTFEAKEWIRSQGKALLLLSTLRTWLCREHGHSFVRVEQSVVGEEDNLYR
jgi:hypothetical protein